jgi:hypothetical protein
MIIRARRPSRNSKEMSLVLVNPAPATRSVTMKLSPISFVL